MRRWLRLLPLAALTLGSTWSGARASSETPADSHVEVPATPALEHRPAVDHARPARLPSAASPRGEFAFTPLRRW